ncbi:Photoreceptor cilium actin regulator, partial [Dissostichus eleginoides]
TKSQEESYPAKNLKRARRAEANHFPSLPIDKLLQVIRSRGGVVKQKTTGILQTVDITIRRECILKSLMIYLGEPVDHLIKEFQLLTITSLDLRDEAPREGVDSRPEEEKGQCFKTDEEENELPLPIEEPHTKEIDCSQLACDAAVAQNTEDIKETEVDTKVDFPPHMVRAHVAAYAYLNPNISKYETLLGLLDQAAQTQLSLQPPMSALVFRFEEINQALEEMAEEGELMLKEHGDNMALQSGMMGPTIMPSKPKNYTGNPPNPPPDLLQQLLQHSTEKLRLVGGSVHALSDTTLEEAVEYFASLSKLLVGKMQAKQAAEQRLFQVLAQVEEAAMRKYNPEKLSLHSEDSGIGGENENLTGSERYRRQRGSAGAGSCGSGFNNRDPSQALFYMCAKYMKDRQPEGKRPLTAATATEYTSSIMSESQKSSDPSISDTVNGNEGGFVINGNNNNNSWPESKDDLDVDNLPPPPPEVLLDNSFQRDDGILGNKEGSQEDSTLNLPIINQKTGVSKRLKTSIQNVEVLPNRVSPRSRSITILPARPLRQDAVMGAQEPEQQSETWKRCGSNELYEGEMRSYSLPVTAPPVSRVRLPPSCPSVCHKFPSPPAFRPQSTSRPSSPVEVTRATDNNNEEIIPSVSFRDARSVFLKKDSQNSQTCFTSGGTVLPKLWEESSRGRLSTRGVDNSDRRTQSERRPTSHSEFSKGGSSTATQAKGAVPTK